MNILDNDKISNIAIYLILLLTIAIIFLILFDFSLTKEESLPNEDIPVNNELAYQEESSDEEDEPIEEIVEEKYKVDIKGAIKNPGVYEVSNNAIVNDIIKLAGGLKSNASTKFINLSKKVSNEMVIYIYTTTEIKNLNITEEKNCYTDKIEISSCEGSSTVETNKNDTLTNNQNNKDEEKDSNLQVGQGKVNINTATKEELMTLNGIGESKAIAIIEYRNTNGNFKTIEDLKNVSGIGDSAFEKIKDNITV